MDKLAVPSLLKMNYKIHEENGINYLSFPNDQTIVKLESDIARSALKMIDGGKTIEDLLSEIESQNKNYRGDKSYILNKMLLILDRANCLEWKNGQNPFDFQEKGLVKQIDQGTTIKKFKESDFKELYDFLLNSGVVSNMYQPNSSENDQNVYFFGVSRQVADWYEELVLRYSLFNYSEDFYVIAKNNEIEGLISICAYRNEFYINLLVYKNTSGWQENIRTLLNHLIEINKLKNLYFEFLSNPIFDKPLIDFLEDCKFQKKAILDNEWVFNEKIHKVYIYGLK